MQCATDAHSEVSGNTTAQVPVELKTSSSTGNEGQRALNVGGSCGASRQRNTLCSGTAFKGHSVVLFSPWSDLSVDSQTVVSGILFSDRWCGAVAELVESHLFVSQS